MGKGGTPSAMRCSVAVPRQSMALKKVIPVLISLGLSAPFLAAARAPLDRPNVIVVFLDDAGYGDFSHTGNPTIHTPNLSKMVADGMNCPQFYCASAACSASRYSILTGRVPARSGLGSWAISPGTPRYLHPKEVTLADGLRERGYATALFGKWHLGSPNKANGFTPDAFPLAHGFDRWLGTNVSGDYQPGLNLVRSEAKGTKPAAGYEVLKSDFAHDAEVSASLTGRYADAAVAFIRENKDKPFYIHLTPNQPHLPVYASPTFKGKSPRGEYGDVIEEIDAQLGRIRSTLTEQGLERNTLIVFSSDNGPWIRFEKTKRHEMYGEARLKVGSALPFRDGKGSDWEGGVRVPGVWCWPGVIPSFSVARAPVSTLDVLPTVFALAGEPLPADRKIDGRDIRPLLNEKAFSGRVPEFTYFYPGSDNRSYGVRSGPWKLLVKAFSQTGNDHGYKVSESRPVLFQVEQDFSERLDVAAEHPEVVARLKTLLDEHRRSVAADGTFWGAETAHPAATTED
jgi:arylsulfatase A